MELLSEAGRDTLTEYRSRANGQAGVQWVSSLPPLIQRICEQWSLSPEPHFENLSYNYVAPVSTKDGSAAVLKLCLPDHDFLCEVEATRAFDGRGCARLLDVDRAAGAVLLERVEPGSELHSLQDDVAETSAVAAVMRELQRPYAGTFVFPRATEWLAAALDPAVLPVRKAEYPWLLRSLEQMAEVASGHAETVLLHGDLHHNNVLSATRAPWLAIDPQGVIGDPAWELAPFLFNRLVRYPRADWPSIIRRRADQICEEMGLDRERVYAWSAVRAVQAAFWSLHDEPSSSGAIQEGAIVCAQVLLE